jgi:hypothetical protein
VINSSYEGTNSIFEAVSNLNLSTPKRGES